MPESGRAAVSAGRPAISHDPADYVARAIIAGLFLGLAYRIGLSALETHRVSGLLLLTSELLVVVLTLARRPATFVDRTLLVRFVAVVSIIGPFLLRPAAEAALFSEPVAMAISGAGLATVVVGKLSLGRSFGLLPANRGVVCSGAYRLIRHPIYLGYLLTHVAFLMANASLWNVVALGTADAALLVRAHLEERTLATDRRYQQYLQLVPWRMIPRVY